MYDNLKSKTALYIEDEADVLENIGTLLGGFFEAFYTAGSAEEGLEYFDKHHIDVVLVDIELPGMDGIACIKHIRQTHPQLPVVVISAYTKTDYLLESIDLHLETYVVKPLTSRKIHALLQRLDEELTDTHTLRCDESVYYDVRRQTVVSNGAEHPLTRRESAFLETLCRKKMVTYDELMLLWENDAPSENAIRSFVKHLRKKLPEGFLKNRNGIGYYVETQ